jgi:hypothetical protein
MWSCKIGFVHQCYTECFKNTWHNFRNELELLLCR